MGNTSASCKQLCFARADCQNPWQWPHYSLTHWFLLYHRNQMTKKNARFAFRSSIFSLPLDILVTGGLICDRNICFRFSKTEERGRVLLFSVSRGTMQRQTRPSNESGWRRRRRRLMEATSGGCNNRRADMRLCDHSMNVEIPVRAPLYGDDANEADMHIPPTIHLTPLYPLREGGFLE